MKIAILGAGLLGSLIARELLAENRDVVIIEKNPNVAKSLVNDLDCIVQDGDGERIDTLVSAGVGEADWFIACTGSDETNIVSCGIVAETFKNVQTIARTRNPYFASFKKSEKRILGVDYIINPEAETAEAIARIIFRGMSPEIIDVKEAGIQLRRLLCKREPRFVGAPLSEVRSRIGPDFMVPAVLRGGALIVPTGNFVFEENDAAYILGEPSMLDKLFGPSKDALRKFNSLVIFGAETLTSLLLQELGIGQIMTQDRYPRGKGLLSLLGNPRIKVIDGNRDLLKALSATFPDIEPINHQLDDEYFMEEENIGSADIVLSLTSHQSVNILTALLAKNAGARRTLALATNYLYSPILYSLDIDIVVNEKTVMSGTILDQVRKAKIRRLYNFPRNEYELIEIQISRSFGSLGAEIRNLDLPKDFLITFVIHEGKTYVPTGNTRIMENDLVGLIIKKEQIGRIETIFGA
jgi:trk system potassium uptake protein TrkA